MYNVNFTNLYQKHYKLCIKRNASFTLSASQIFNGLSQYTHLEFEISYPAF